MALHDEVGRCGARRFLPVVVCKRVLLLWVTTAMAWGWFPCVAASGADDAGSRGRARGRSDMERRTLAREHRLVVLRGGRGAENRTAAGRRRARSVETLRRTVQRKLPRARHRTGLMAGLRSARRGVPAGGRIPSSLEAFWDVPELGGPGTGSCAGR